MGPGLGSWLWPNSSLEPGAHNPRSSKSLDRRRLPAVVQSGVFGCVEDGVSKPAEGSEGAGTLTEQQLRKVIQRKLVAYKRQDAAKRLRFNLKVDHILELKEAESNRCAACNIELLLVYQPKDTQQFSVDRLDNTMGHTRDNTRLTCLECNRKRDYAVLNA